NIINKKFLQAAWLKELLQKEDEYAIKTAAWQAVTKLWVELAYEIKQSLDDFIQLWFSFVPQSKNFDVLLLNWSAYLCNFSDEIH
ncbi:hypothetical protein, partial [Escherichia coli]|uniref:hypothetical protein n=1 Tax=Escherichia coli TaxID=562 RepID=UPI003EE3754E